MLRFSLSLALIIFCIVSLSFGFHVKGGDLSKLFELWFGNNGGKLHGVNVTFYEGMGRGLNALKSIKANDLILSVPSNLLFSLRSMQTSRVSEVKAIYNAFPPNLVLSLWIVHELNQLNSSFKAYLDILPKHVPSLLTFSAEELKLLHNEELMLEAEALQQEVHAEFVSFQNIARNLGQSLPASLYGVSREEYVWAATIINSRGLRFQGEVYLAPMADLFNYEPHYDTRTANSGEFFLKHHVLDKSGGITVYADRSQSKGLQLFEDYGDNTNDIYIKYHGFVPTKNPFHCVKMGGETVLSEMEALFPYLFHIRTLKSDSYEDVKQKLFHLLRFKQRYPSCMNEESADLGKHLEVYLTLMAMMKDDASACLEVVELQHQNKNIGWKDIYSQCGFSSLPEVVRSRIIQSNITEALNCKDQSCLEQKQALLSPLEVAKSLRGLSICYDVDRYRLNLRCSEKSAGERMWLIVQTFIAVSVLSQKFPTGIHEDILELESIQATLLSLNNNLIKADDQIVHLSHVELAIRYRISNKRLYLKLCYMFGLDCSFLIYSNGYSKLDDVKSALQRFQIITEAKSLSSEPENSLALYEAVREFNEWFYSHNPLPSKLIAAYLPPFRLAALTTERVAKGDVYVGVPMEIIIDADKAYYQDSNLGQLLRSLQKLYKHRDYFHELLFFLLHEKFMLKEKSFYAPYLRLLPTLEDFQKHLLLFQTREKIVENLRVSSLFGELIQYQESVHKKFFFIQNISVVTELFTSDILTEDNYLWATAILDSRSIWWEGKRHLVPMLDLVNCQVLSNSSAVHSTVLSSIRHDIQAEEKLFATTKAGDEFDEGEQLFENYGQPNHIYYLYHGFILTNNSHDCVKIDFEVLPQELANWQTQGLSKLMQHLGLEANRFQSCVHWPLEPPLWAFLALKSNFHSEALRKKTLGYPCLPCAQFLHAFLSTKLQEYSDFIPTVKDERSFRFLLSERKVLETTSDSLIKFISSFLVLEDEL